MDAVAAIPLETVLAAQMAPAVQRCRAPGRELLARRRLVAVTITGPEQPMMTMDPELRPTKRHGSEHGPWRRKKWPRSM
jgi:hypothetical protein